MPIAVPQVTITYRGKRPCGAFVRQLASTCGMIALCSNVRTCRLVHWNDRSNNTTGCYRASCEVYSHVGRSGTSSRPHSLRAHQTPTPWPGNQSDRAALSRVRVDTDAAYLNWSLPLVQLEMILHLRTPEAKVVGLILLHELNALRNRCGSYIGLQ